MLSAAEPQRLAYSYLAAGEGPTQRLRLAVSFESAPFVLITTATLVRIERMLDDHFRSEMMTYITTKGVHTGKVRLRKTLDEFFGAFGITPDDIDQDRCVKHYQRHCQDWAMYKMKGF
jgi:hypothetical protein